MRQNAIIPGSLEGLSTAVEVEIWEGYLLRNNTGVGKALCTYSLDNGPLNESEAGNLTFRFMLFDWQNNIQDLLARNNIHFAILRKEEADMLHRLLKKNIFVAEDDPNILLCLQTILENAGYHVRVSACGAPVVEGNFSSIDLFILDNQMPDINGVEVCRFLRSQSRTRDTPVILISAIPNCGNEALNAGADDYIVKPFHMHYLLNVVAKFMRRTGREG